jgi:hypothetical protein
MIDRSTRTDGAAPAGNAARMLAALLCCLVWSVVYAADNAYLELLDAEVAKVGGAVTDTGGDAAAATRHADAPVDTRQRASRERFEALLRERHIGTYSFYRRLPERSREEIFLNYARGEAMDVLRDKIVDRYLHP